MVAQPVDEAAPVRRDHHRLQGLHHRRGTLLRQAEVQVLVKPEIKHHLQPIAVAEIMTVIFYGDVYFSQEYRIGVEALHNLPEMVQERVASRLVALPGLFHQMRCGIEAKA